MMHDDRATGHEWARRVLGFAGGFLVGGLVGAGIALFATPMSGDDNRRLVQGKLAEVQGGIRQVTADARSNVARLGEGLSE